MSSRLSVLLAAGSGRRMGFVKQFQKLGNRPVWKWSLETLFAAGVSRVAFIVPEDDVPLMEEALRDDPNSDRVLVAAGGNTRGQSSQRGILRLLADIAIENWQSTYICVHDAARPFLTVHDTVRVFERAEVTGAAILAQRCKDTVKEEQNGVIVRTLPREALWLAQTPQCARADWFVDAYKKCDVDCVTDEAMLLEACGRKVELVEVQSFNGKLTVPEDWKYAEWIVMEKGQSE
ncbi:IspD/TarI family cytidylyltransferase [Alicyclobacillus tolerans]|uniref:IspD/TarI family cytidylyltransferase n=1 Tax=Alicyclobacillus tolerans TaxID=90970 RepID=UPI003B7FD74B